MDYKVLGKQFITEIARVVVAAVIPVVLAYFNLLSPEVAAVLTVVIKGADKGLHKAGVDKGIVRF